MSLDWKGHYPAREHAGLYALTVPNTSTGCSSTTLAPADLTSFRVFRGTLCERIRSEFSQTGIFEVNELGPYIIRVTDVSGCRRTVEGVIGQ